MIKNIVVEPEVGEEYDAKVVSIMPYGAFVEFMPGKEGLLHVSEMDWKRVENVEDVLTVGQELKVKLLDVDSRTGKFKLSRKVLLPKPEGYVERPPRDKKRRNNGNNHGNRNGNRKYCSFKKARSYIFYFKDACKKW